MHSPLLWKEWREQRMLVLIALGWSAITPFLVMMVDSLANNHRGMSLRDLAHVLPVMLIGFGWPCFLLIAGANTIANEMAEGTLGFLLSRPVSRTRLWSTKVLMAATAGGIVLAGILAICWTLALISGESSIILSRLSDDRPFAGLVLPGIVIAFGISGLLFATAVLCSTVIPRTLTAAAAALATSLGLVAALVFLWSRLDLAPRLELDWLALQLLLSGLVILGGSFWIFTRAETLSRGRRAAVCAAVALAGLPAAALPSILSLTRLDSGEAVLAELALPASGGDVIATAARPDGGSPRIWSIAADGTGVTPLTGRLAMSPAVSPDGRRVAYLSARGPLGLRSSSASLRILSLADGTDRVVASGLNILSRTMTVFSPDGAQLAMEQNDRLIVTSIDGGQAASCTMQTGGGSRSWLLGFTPGSAEALVLRAGRTEDTPARLMAVTPGAGMSTAACEERLLHDFGEPAALVGLMRPRQSGRFLSLVTEVFPRENRFRTLHVIDLVSGARRELTRTSCFGPADFSRDERILAYAECPPGGHATIHRVSVDDWKDAILAVVPVRALSLHISPSGDRVAVDSMPWDGNLADVVIEADGQVTPLNRGWTVLGWNGDNRLVMADAPEGGGQHTRLALAAAGDWEPREFFPRSSASP